MRRPVILWALALAGPVQAERLACSLTPECRGDGCPTDVLTLTFDIDRTQFVRPMFRFEPPRRLVTRVFATTEDYAAEPILMGDGTRGFHAELPDRDRLLTIALDGTAIYTDTETRHRRTGTCKEIAE